MLIIRLKKKGKKNDIIFDISVFNKKKINTTPIENIGYYIQKKNTYKKIINILYYRLIYWKRKGAKLSNRVKKIEKIYKKCYEFNRRIRK